MRLSVIDCQKKNGDSFLWFILVSLIFILEWNLGENLIDDTRELKVLSENTQVSDSTVKLTVHQSV